LAATISQVALVTGSGKKRIGWHVAEALAGRGYAVAVHYRSSAMEAAQTVEHLRGRGVEAVALQADLADEKAVSGLFRAVWHRFGRLDVLVNCAAVYQAKRLEEVTGTGRRVLAEQLTREAGSSTQLVGWSPDGKAARLSRDWKSEEVGKWEEEHKDFRTTGEGVCHDIYLVDLASSKATKEPPVEEKKSALIKSLVHGRSISPDGRMKSQKGQRVPTTRGSSWARRTRPSAFSRSQASSSRHDCSGNWWL
jgi:hypothetical protein